MPTYEYVCPVCGSYETRVQSIRAYDQAPERPECCNLEMGRHYSVQGGDSLMNAQYGDRHYDGMRATDGTPIDSRTKHRAYMKAKGLTTADDYTQTWAKAQKERETFRSAGHTDKHLRETVSREFYSKNR